MSVQPTQVQQTAGNQALQSVLSAGRSAPGPGPAIHEGHVADLVLSDLGARGAAVGRNILLSRSLGAAERASVLGHEMRHVAQTGGRDVDPAAPLSLGSRGDRWERAARGTGDPGSGADPQVIRRDGPPVSSPGDESGVCEPGDSPPLASLPEADTDADAGTCDVDETAVLSTGSEPLTTAGEIELSSDPARHVCALPYANASFDPEAVDVDGMGNTLLNTESIRVDNWVQSHAFMSPRHADLSAYQRLQARLKAERNKRVREGHLWLTTATAQIPSSLYMIMNYGGQRSIVAVDSEVAAGRPETSPPGPIMTSVQFYDHMSSMGIEVLSEEEYYRRQLQGNEDVIPFGMTGEEFAFLPMGPDAARQGVQGSTVMLAGSGAQASPFSRAARGDFSMNPGANLWHGNMAEAGVGSSGRYGFGLFLDDLNTQGWTDFRTSPNVQHSPSERNAPVFDFQRVQGSRGVEILGVQRISVKSSRLEEQSARLGSYRSGLQEMLGVMPNRTNLDAYMLDMPGQSGVAVGSQAHADLRTGVLADARIAVNSDDVAEFRRLLSDAGSRWGTNYAAYRRIYSAMLRDNPITIEVNGTNVTLSSVADVDAAGLSPQQLADVQAEVGRRAAGLVVSSGVTTQQLNNLRAARQGIHSNMSDADIDRTVTSDWIETALHGNNRRGLAVSTGRSAARGAGMNTVISVVTTAGMMLIDEAEHPGWAGELVEAGGLGALGGAVETGVEHVAVSRGTNFALQRGVTWMSASRLRLFGGGMGATIGAPIVEGVSMGLLEDRPMQEGEVPTRLARSTGIGLTSYAAGAGAQAATTGFIAVMLSSGGTGAASGSVVPGWGTAIGLVVGLGVGFGTYLALENNVPGGRADYDADFEARQQEAAHRRRQQEERERRAAAERARMERLGATLNDLSASTVSVEALFGMDVQDPAFNSCEEGVEPTIGELEAAYIAATLRTEPVTSEP